MSESGATQSVQTPQSAQPAMPVTAAALTAIVTGKREDAKSDAVDLSKLQSLRKNLNQICEDLIFFAGSKAAVLKTNLDNMYSPTFEPLGSLRMNYDELMQAQANVFSWNTIILATEKIESTLVRIESGKELTSKDYSLIEDCTTYLQDALRLYLGTKNAEDVIAHFETLKTIIKTAVGKDEISGLVADEKSDPELSKLITSLQNGGMVKRGEREYPCDGLRPAWRDAYNTAVNFKQNNVLVDGAYYPPKHRFDNPLLNRSMYNEYVRISDGFKPCAEQLEIAAKFATKHCSIMDYDDSSLKKRYDDQTAARIAKYSQSPAVTTTVAAPRLVG